MKHSGFARAADDWYVEPAWIVNALLDVEQFRGLCWDAACGGGNIPVTLAKRNMPCFASDIVDRGCPGSVVQDFFVSTDRADHIISNPPYGCLEHFVRLAWLRTTGKVAVLARLAFLEGKARRDGLFRDIPLARVWVSSRRPSMPPGGVDVPAKGGSIAYAWFVFDHATSGAPTLGWLP